MTTCAPLQVNFAPRSVKSLLFTTPLWALALAVLGLGLMLYSLLSIHAIHAQSQILSATAQRMENHLKILQKPAAKALVIPEARALMINAAVQQLNLPWSDVFDAIEAATPANIALVSIEPDARKQLIKGAAEAISSDDMIAYIKNLKKQPLFVNVMLTKHEVNQQDQYKPYRFEFTAQWKGPVP